MRTQRVHINIPVAHFGPVLSWDTETIGRMVQAAAGIAVQVGLRLDDDGAGPYLKEAETKGARVDWNSRDVVFTAAQIEETMAVMRKTQPAPMPLRERTLAPQGREQQFTVGNGANLLFDWAAWQAVAPTAADLVDLCHWAQGCADVDMLVQPVMLKDVDQNLEPLYSYALMARHCRKKVLANQPTEPIHVRYLHRMQSLVESHRGFHQAMLPYEYINPPFHIGSRAVATMLARVDSGACTAMGVGAMAVAGMSAPVTVAGAAVTSLAEILAGLTLFRILRPGYGLVPNACSGALDLRTARVSYFGMHTHLVNLALWELLVRGVGVDSPCLTWYRDANEPGIQALYEFGMAQALFSSVLNKATPEIGGLACGNTFSPHQATLDIEACKEFNELAYGFEVSDHALGLEEVVRARFEQGFHMSSEHTLAFMPDGIPFSAFLPHGWPGGACHDKAHTQTDVLLERAAEAVETARLKGREAGPDTELGDALYACVREAAAELKIEAPPLP